ncbi:MAG: beta-alanine degradation protein BauB [Betaproteobacteria bacterium]|jgi:hypothetical protein|nr:beta-alanine degradation protein BauB [Betaproteobacteria bacterium]
MSTARILSAAALALGLVATGPLHAQSKERAPQIKVLLENAKVRVTETTFLPGDVSRADRKARTNYVVTDGKLERTTKDGKKSVYERKAGTAVWMEADKDVVRNVGKTTYVVIGVTQK